MFPTLCIRMDSILDILHFGPKSVAGDLVVHNIIRQPRGLPMNGKTRQLFRRKTYNKSSVIVKKFNSRMPKLKGETGVKLSMRHELTKTKENESAPIHSRPRTLDYITLACIRLRGHIVGISIVSWIDLARTERLGKLNIRENITSHMGPLLFL